MCIVLLTLAVTSWYGGNNPLLLNFSLSENCPSKNATFGGENGDGPLKPNYWKAYCISEL